MPTCVTIECVEILRRVGDFTPPGDALNHYVEHFRVPDLSIGTYSIPTGGIDDQTPHHEDEIYIITAGRARVVTPSGVADVGPGSVVFVPAHEEHRFVDITEDLALIVIFGPAYRSRPEP